VGSRLVLLAAAFSVIAAWPAPAGAANKDIERLQMQVATLQGQVIDLQRLAEDNNKELRRLNEALAEQGAITRKSLQDRRVQDEAISAALKDILERVADLTERVETASRAPAVAPQPVDGAVAGGALPGPGPGAPPAGAPPAGPAPAPRELYSQAYADYARGNFDLAIQEYLEYLRNYPDTDLSDNAQYWIGECYYSKQKYVEAIDAWNELFRQYPASDKLPDARFKKGMALERLGRRSQALIEYRYVVDRYPNSEAGRKAREKLSP
jgi:tol-pal system protein YbgF